MDQSSTNQHRSVSTQVRPFFTLESFQGGARVKSEEVQQQGDPLVLNTIQLLAHKRALDRLLDMVETYKTAITSGELERMPPLAPPPHMPEVVPVTRFVRLKCLTTIMSDAF